MKLKYRCPYCQVNSYSKQWNATTRIKYGNHSDGEICEIQDEENNSYHLCPSCGAEGEMFKGSLIIDPTEQHNEVEAEV
jgi:RNA polymerase subunit RPABC4/transcription elongation factor Spt4